MTLAELIEKCVLDSSIEPFLTPEEIEKCCQKAALETGWSFPVAGAFRVLWIENRAQRHAFFMLWTQAARKFKVEQLSLNQRFDHYGKIIEKMDADFADAVAENPAEFADVQPHKAFGSVVGPGFVYDIAGNDITRFVT